MFFVFLYFSVSLLSLFRDLFENKNYFSPIHSGKPGVVKLLIEYGAGINLKNNYEDTALHLAANKGQSVVLINAVYQRGKNDHEKK